MKEKVKEKLGEVDRGEALRRDEANIDALAKGGGQWFIDKTPRYILIVEDLKFVERVFF